MYSRDFTNLNLAGWFLPSSALQRMSQLRLNNSVIELETLVCTTSVYCFYHFGLYIYICNYVNLSRAHLDLNYTKTWKLLKARDNNRVYHMCIKHIIKNYMTYPRHGFLRGNDSAGADVPSLGWGVRGTPLKIINLLFHSGWSSQKRYAPGNSELKIISYQDPSPHSQKILFNYLRGVQPPQK